MTMNIVLTCPDCERLIELAVRPMDGKLLCPTCRAYIVVPPTGEAAVEPDGVYTTPEVKKCPRCKKAMEAVAVMCINCGFDLRSGKQTGKVVHVQATARSWICGLVPLYFLNVGLRKTSAGQKLVTVTPRLLGIPLGTTEIDLLECREIWTDYRQGFGAVGLTIMLLMCLLCLVPGLAWWIRAMNTQNYIVRLPYKRTHVTLYEGENESKMRDILDTVATMGKLTIVRK